MMVEVFKTNVAHKDHADMLVELIHKTFREYTANFDLQDCDKILRVQCSIGSIHPLPIIALLNDVGFQAEVLPDEARPFGEGLLTLVTHT